MKKLFGLLFAFLFALPLFAQNPAKHRDGVQVDTTLILTEMPVVNTLADTDIMLTITGIDGQVRTITWADFKTQLPATSTGLESITEGANTGWRLAGTDPTLFGDIGNESVDFTFPDLFDTPSTTRGARGDRSFSVGEDNEISPAAYAGFVGGSGNLIGNGSYNFMYGNGNDIIVNANSSAVFGDSNTISFLGSYSFISGISNTIESTGSFIHGINNYTYGDYSTAFGRDNETNTEYEFMVGESGTFKANRLFNVGVGDWDIAPADGLSVFKDGHVTAPEMSNAEIDAGTNDYLTTKGWVNSKGFAELSSQNNFTNWMSITGNSNALRLIGDGTGITNNVYMSFYEIDGTTRQGYIGFGSGASSDFVVRNDVTSQNIVLDESGGNNGLQFFDGASTRNVYHTGNLIIDEDSFTPALIDTGGGATYTGTMTGYYVRNGSQVTINISMTSVNTTGTPNGLLQITGLPFPQRSGFSSRVDWARVTGGTIGEDSFGEITSGSTSISFRNFIFAASTSAITFTNGNIKITGTYLTN